ncbi:MAG: hypothetical protein WCJ30_26400, partial [Deltaproteobacteria bacterium]
VAVAAITAAVATGACRRAPRQVPEEIEEGPAQAHARPRVAWDPAERARTIADGRAAIERAQCNRCHNIDDIEPAARALHCQSCHEFLSGLTPTSRQWSTLVTRYGEDVLRRYQRNMQHYLRVPALTRIGRRLRPSWIRGYVQAPFDLRPMLDETMVRMQITDADAHAIARYFAAVAEVEDPDRAPPRRDAPPADAARLREGRALFDRFACGNCHSAGNLATGRSIEDLRRMGVLSQMAPNLRFVRDRIDPETIVEWLLDPQSIAPGTLMPTLGLTRTQAETLRDFLLAFDPELRPTPAAPSTTPAPPAARPVGWAEVKERVFGFVCVHCHMNDHERDNGPGNRGGFGWPGSQLQMRTYETLVSGAVGRDGVRYSVLVPRPGETVPPIVSAMMRRRPEEVRDHVAPFDDHAHPPFPANQPPGMPMGLPHITDEQIGLVSAWIAQGCPGPAGVTGMPGIRDGFLVPDGPIVPNTGCELRLPSPTRPAWSTQPPPPWERAAGPGDAGTPARSAPTTDAGSARAASATLDGGVTR